MRILLFCFLIPFCIIVKGQNFVNDIVFPRNTYMMSGCDNEIYFQPFLKRWRPYDDFIRFDKIKGLKIHTGKRVVFKDPKDNDTLTIRLINGDEFSEIKKIKSTIHLATPGIGEDSVKVMFLGDSYTKGNFFKSAVLDSGFVPKVKLIGTINVKDSYPHAHEGRGGWTLQNYFSNKPENEFYYNPFWQPEGQYRYWGSTAFWKNCHYVAENNVKEFNLKYFCNGYDLSNYNKSGKRISPSENDLMWDSDLHSYIIWTGKGWVKYDASRLRWGFDYAKYIEMNNFDKPEFLFVLLGLNDFRNGAINPDFEKWNERIEMIYQSYRKAVPDGKFVLCTPCSSCGTLENSNGDFTTRQNAVMWNVRKNIIEKFDGREDDGFYVIDIASTIDNEHGYKTYNGIQINNPHPYLNYYRLGLPLAAFIQYYR